MGKMIGGGVESVVMNYYRHIDRSRVQFDLLVDEDSTLVPREEVESLGGRIIKVPPYQNLSRYMRALECLFNKERWSIVHSHINGLSCFSLYAAKRTGVPIRIAHSHSTSGRGEYAKNLLKAILRTQANRYPTHRLACSIYAGEWLFGKNAEFEVLRNAIELGEFAFDSEVRSKVRTELDIAKDQLVIGHVGRFTAQKNHRFLIDIFREVCRLRPDAVLLLVGSGELRHFVESLLIQYDLLNNVRFLGQRNDVNLLYQAFDAFVLPSLYEGLGLVGIEAQATGLSCFFSDLITREVDVTGEARFLPIDDVNTWSYVLAQVAVGQRYKVDIESFVDYDINRAAEKLANYYENLYAGVIT
ncbi:glycosyltransferase family 1 protein [Adlercreutzia sp. ZJ304]|uniref:glycosyltransferase family 1 protein n=1 Tax=Adlercreutzia sp. ZJ304 TaxID=2709791 RepID=UPI001F14CCF2|nr:glycosyltransferase family 1 protein [Adlercreutzia sp. ZJ304]